MHGLPEYAKAWCDIALKIIWAEVDDLCALFSILAPSSLSVEGGVKCQTFTRLPHASDWRRFDKHATLVRRLKYTATDEDAFSRLILRDISQTRIRHQIFPNLHTLKWIPSRHYHRDKPNPSDVIACMHEGVKRFTIRLPEYTEERKIEQSSVDVPLRMPRLTEIGIYPSIGVIKLDKPLFHLVSNLHTLEKISIPSKYLTNCLTDALSLLPALSSILSLGSGSAALLEHAQLVVPTQRFKSLQEIDVKHVLTGSHDC